MKNLHTFILSIVLVILIMYCYPYELNVTLYDSRLTLWVLHLDLLAISARRRGSSLIHRDDAELVLPTLDQVRAVELVR